MSAPRIAVTCPDRGGEAMWLCTRLGLALAGGRAVRVTSSRLAPEDAPGFLRNAHGLLLGGGADVHPELYGEEISDFLDELRRSEPGLTRRLFGLALYPAIRLLRRLFGLSRLPSSGSPRDPGRDALENALCREALARELPILGICRGMQLLNVTLGGSLYQDVAAFYAETPRLRTILPRKRIHVAAGSRLAVVLGKRARVNALHHQAVKELGKGLRAVAHDAQGVVQALERDGEPMVIGVQWHPEFLPHRPEQRALFRALVSAARERAALSSSGR